MFKVSHGDKYLLFNDFNESVPPKSKVHFDIPLLRAMAVKRFISRLF